MRIIVDIDDVTGAVTITPETQDPDVGAAEERRMTEVRSGICAPAPRSPLSPDTDLPVPGWRVDAELLALRPATVHRGAAMRSSAVRLML